MQKLYKCQIFRLFSHSFVVINILVLKLEAKIYIYVNFYCQGIKIKKEIILFYMWCLLAFMFFNNVYMFIVQYYQKSRNENHICDDVLEHALLYRFLYKLQRFRNKRCSRQNIVINYLVAEKFVISVSTHLTKPGLFKDQYFDDLI